MQSAQKTLKIAKDNDDFVSYPSKFPSILITNLGLKKLLVCREFLFVFGTKISSLTPPLNKVT